jgi:hypothetical protein
VGDDFWFMAHGDASGRPRLAMDVMGVALAGALLAELVIARAVVICGGRVACTGARGPADFAAQYVLATISGEQAALSPQDWLTFLGPGASGLVARRLHHEGLVMRHRSHVSGRRARWRPSSEEIAALPAVRVTNRLLRLTPFDPPSVLLAGLVRASNLSNPLLYEVRVLIRSELDPLVQQLSPSLCAVLEHVEAAIGHLVTVRR